MLRIINKRQKKDRENLLYNKITEKLKESKYSTLHVFYKSIIDVDINKIT